MNRRRFLFNSKDEGVDIHTLLLLKFNSSGPYDLSMYKHTIKNNGCRFSYSSMHGSGRSVSKSSIDYYLNPDTDFVGQIVGKGEFTIECFVNMPYNSECEILTKDHTGDTGGWFFKYIYGFKDLRCFYWNENVNYATGGSIVGNGWNHLCVTYKNSLAKLYINGILKASNTVTRNDLPSHKCMIFGRVDHDSGQSNSSSMRMDCLRISDVCRYDGNFTPAYFEG